MSNAIRVGVIGTGFGSLVHIPGYQAVPGYDVVGVCSAPADRPEVVASELGIPFSCTDFRELLALPGLDLVSIATPPYLHHEMAVAALEAGKHVPCEKPLALDAAQGRRMAESAAAARVVHVVNHEFRYHPARARLRDLVRSGYLGQVYTVDLNMFFAGRASRDQPTWNWWSQRERGGGSLGAVLSHWIDLFRWTFGEYSGVYGELDHFVGERLDASTGEYRPVTSNDSLAWIARLSSGVQVVAHFSSTARFGEQHPFAAAPLRIFGSEGTLVLDSKDRLWGARVGDVELTLLHEGDPEAPAETGPPGAGDRASLLLGFGPFKRLLEQLRRAIVDGEPVHPTFEDGMRVQEMMDAIAISQTERRWVPLPPPA